MAEFRARIGRIRMKNGGAEIRMLRQEREIPDQRGELLRHGRQVIEGSEESDPLVGHVIIGLFSSGKTTCGFAYDPDTFPIPRALFPVWFADILRRELIIRSEAIGVFEEMFE